MVGTHSLLQSNPVNTDTEGGMESVHIDPWDVRIKRVE